MGRGQADHAAAIPAGAKAWESARGNERTWRHLHPQASCTREQAIWMWSVRKLRIYGVEAEGMRMRCRWNCVDIVRKEGAEVVRIHAATCIGRSWPCSLWELTTCNLLVHECARRYSVIMAARRTGVRASRAGAHGATGRLKIRAICSARNSCETGPCNRTVAMFTCSACAYNFRYDDVLALAEGLGIHLHFLSPRLADPDFGSQRPHPPRRG
jgi:hypothetical protein